jgi:hypothetical protein
MDASTTLRQHGIFSTYSLKLDRRNPFRFETMEISRVTSWSAALEPSHIQKT